MKTDTQKNTVDTITTHYIEGAFVESRGREVMDIVRSSGATIIARVARAIA